MPRDLETVFLARVADTSWGRAAVLLSSRERRRWRGISHRGRRDEFLAARILVKYLWWAPSFPAAAAAAVHCVPREALHAFLDSARHHRGTRRRCRWVELLAGPDGAPELRWRGRSLDALSVSVTHTAGWAAVAMAKEGRVGLDLERIEMRSPSFASLFSPAERAWCEAQAGLPPHAGLTLLWALREAALKAGVGGQGDGEPFEVVPRAAAPDPSRGTQPWALQSLAVELPGRRSGLARVHVDEGFVLARLALDPPGPDLASSLESHPGRDGGRMISAGEGGRYR